MRRISELKEQCQLEQKAKRHLEEELRSDLEEKQHVINALQTKVTLLKSGGKSVIDDNGEEDTLVDVTDPNENHEDGSFIKSDSGKIASLEGKNCWQGSLGRIFCLLKRLDKKNGFIRIRILYILDNNIVFTSKYHNYKIYCDMHKKQLFYVYFCIWV